MLMLFSAEFVVAHPARSMGCVVLGERKRSVALGVLASSFQADAMTEARGRFVQACPSPMTFPRLRAERQEREGLAAGSMVAFLGEGRQVRKRGKDLEALMAPTARRGARCGQWPCSLQPSGAIGYKGHFSSPESLWQINCRNGPNAPSFPHHVQRGSVVLPIKQLSLFVYLNFL